MINKTSFSILTCKNQATILSAGFFYKKLPKLARRFFTLSRFFFLLLCLATAFECYAEVMYTEKTKKEKLNDILPTTVDIETDAAAEEKKIQGIVSGISPFGIGVEYGSDEKRGTLEVWLDRMKETTVTSVNDFTDIQMGDTVEITFKETVDEGQKILTNVRLVEKKAPESNEIPPEVEGAE